MKRITAMIASLLVAAGALSAQELSNVVRGNPLTLSSATSNRSQRGSIFEPNEITVLPIAQSLTHITYHIKAA